MTIWATRCSYSTGDPSIAQVDIRVFATTIDNSQQPPAVDTILVAEGTTNDHGLVEVKVMPRAGTLHPCVCACCVWFALSPSSPLWPLCGSVCYPPPT
jgi:hypothetical protein